MTKLFVLTLQPLRERYTEYWYYWFKDRLCKYFDEIIYVDGDILEHDIGNGAFLPIAGSYYWEFTQLSKMTKLIHSGAVSDDDIVLAMDIEFPGHAVAVKYLLQKMGLNTKVYGWLHAGSYTKGDFVQFLEPSMKYFEMGWLMAFDGIFVASKYHKQAILKRRVFPLMTNTNAVDATEIYSKIHVVGNPFYVDWAWSLAGISEPKPFEEREYDIIISDRPDVEKNIAWALAIAVASNAKKIAVCTGRKEWRGWNFKHIRTLAERLGVDIYEGLSKREYYRLLNNSKIWLTASHEENFGYCAVEALAFRTIPVMPNCCAFPEHVDYNPKYLYDNFDDAVYKINRFLRHGDNTQLENYVRKYEETLDLVASIMLSRCKPCLSSSLQ